MNKKNNNYLECCYIYCISILLLIFIVIFVITFCKTAIFNNNIETTLTIEATTECTSNITENTTETIVVSTEPIITTEEHTTKKQQFNNYKKGFGQFKSYTDYRCLNRNSKQWQIQAKAYTDENGLRKIGNAYLVAMGSYYGTQLGVEYSVTLSNGNQFDIVLCDCKKDIHTDKLHRECVTNGSVLEFYVDSRKLSKKVKTSGSISSISYFNGYIIDINKK